MNAAQRGQPVIWTVLHLSFWWGEYSYFCVKCSILILQYIKSFDLLQEPVLQYFYCSCLLGFWVHCNDSKLNMCTMEEVCKAQAYILFYTQRITQANGHCNVSALDSPSGKQPNTEVNCSSADSNS